MKRPKRICLIEVWLGKIPDYFRFHIKTLKQIECVDFYFYTDDRSYDFSKIDLKNFKVNYITEEEFIDRFNRTADISIDRIQYAKKIVDFKLSYFSMFPEIIENYDYVGIYDIDTLFGDIESDLVDAMHNGFDFISIGDKEFCNRLSGPLLIFKNTKELINLYRNDRYYETLQLDEIYGYGEKELSDLAMRSYRTKILEIQNLNQKIGGKIEFHSVWTNGKIWSNGRELGIYHFYHKNKTRFLEVGDDTIISGYDKVIANDFVWVTGFDRAYAKIAEGLLRSILKYSNRPCLVYSINFDWAIPADLFASGQFMVKRLDLENADLGSSERNTDVVNYKPKYMIDAIKTLPKSKFAFIDADCSITANADSVRDYLPDLENYPLLNCHTHDDIIVYSGEDRFNSLEMLLRRMGFQRTVYPRRKANFMLFDSRSEWFFQEQIDLYEQHRGSEPWIFALQDEDSANALLSKYEFKKSLPVIDIEESKTLDLSKYSSYSFGSGSTSIKSSIPTHPNQIITFHQVKKPEDFAEIDANYGRTVIPQEEMIVEYKNGSLTWQRNLYRPSSEIPQTVDFVVYAGNYRELHSLRRQSFRDYWFFSINEIDLQPGVYPVKMMDSYTGRVIHSDLIQIQR